MVTAPIVQANSFEDIPAKHWIYNALTELVVTELILYPIELAREFGFSRMEAAMLVAMFVEQYNPDIAIRQAEQTQAINTIVERYASRAELNRQVLQKYQSSTGDYRDLLPILPQTAITEIYDAILWQWIGRVSTSETDLVEYGRAMGQALALLSELVREISLLGVEITEIERSLSPLTDLNYPEYQLLIDTGSCSLPAAQQIIDFFPRSNDKDDSQPARNYSRDTELYQSTIRDQGTQRRSQSPIDPLFAQYRLINFSNSVN